MKLFKRDYPRFRKVPKALDCLLLLRDHQTEYTEKKITKNISYSQFQKTLLGANSIDRLILKDIYLAKLITAQGHDD